MLITFGFAVDLSRDRDPPFRHNPAGRVTRGDGPKVQSPRMTSHILVLRNATLLEVGQGMRKLAGLRVSDLHHLESIQQSQHRMQCVSIKS